MKTKAGLPRSWFAERNAKMAIDYLRGKNIKDIAEEKGLSYETIRRSIFSSIWKSHYLFCESNGIKYKDHRFTGLQDARKNKGKVIPMIQEFGY